MPKEHNIHYNYIKISYYKLKQDKKPLNIYMFCYSRDKQFSITRKYAYYSIIK